MSVNQECETVKNNIQKWLLERGYKIQSQPNKDALFQFLVTDDQGLKTNVIQSALKLDQIVIVTGINIDETQRGSLQVMEGKGPPKFPVGC